MSRLVVALAAVFLGVVLIAAVRSIARWRGPRRVAAVLAFLLALGWEISIAVAIQRDPTSHNLWPIESAVVAGGLLAALVGIGLFRSRRSPLP